MATSVQTGKAKQLTLLGFFAITASMVMAVYEYPTFATSGFSLVFFLLLGGILWFIPVGLCAAEMATVDGWEEGGVFAWVSNTLGPRWGFAAISFGYLQIAIGFIPMLYFVLWIDKEEYPQSAAIDLRCVNMVADLWHAPAPKNGQAVGTNTIGSSEACMLGGMAMKWRWRKRMEAAGKPTDKPNLVCGPVQICWHKFARYWDVELREIPMRPGQLFMDPKRMIEACDENTIGVVPTFGVTYTGNYEFPQPLHDALDKFQADTGIDIDMHIDAASGGFLAPFVAPDIVWDFRLPRVKSISASGHKFGLAPLGCGWVIWRDEEALPQELVFNVDYLGGQIGTFAINFSRPAGQVIAQYYEFLRLGREGYTKVQNASYQVAAYLADEIAKLGPYEFICTGRPDEGIPAVCFKLKDGEDPGYTLYDLSERLRLRGWQVPAFTLGGEATDIVVMRIMCRRGFEMDFAELLLEDYKASLKYLSDHPKLQGIAQQNSFKHT